ncbi:MAG: hypothetical protein E6772_16700 [Dysgonomonas sp.]|nr:hypothetical protein [Dysgonomonas sp.]
MPNAKHRAAEKIKRNLFLPKDELKDRFSELEYERKKRIMFCVTQKLDAPIISDKEIVDLLVSGCDGACIAVTSSTAYRDLRLINEITGNIRLASKDWERYMVVETAKAEIKKYLGKDGKAVAALLKVIIQARQLDQDDKENVFDQMIPFDPEITNDPSVLGDDIELIDNVEDRRKELRQLFRKREVEDIEIMEDGE